MIDELATALEDPESAEAFAMAKTGTKVLVTHRSKALPNNNPQFLINNARCKERPRRTIRMPGSVKGKLLMGAVPRKSRNRTDAAMVKLDEGMSDRTEARS